MRILRIEAEGIFLFEGKAVIDFNAEQRVYPDNAAMLYNPFGNIQIMFYHLLVLMHPEKRPPLN